MSGAHHRVRRRVEIQVMKGLKKVTIFRLCGALIGVSLILSSCASTSNDNELASSSADAVQTSSPSDSSVGTSGSDSAEATGGADPVNDDAARSTIEKDAALEEQAGKSSNDVSSDEADEEPEFTYEDEPEPAPELAATLCNLDADYFRGLRGTDPSGKPVADDSLGMAVLSLGDNLSLWNDLQRSFPEVEADVATAQKVYENWDEALIRLENGNDDDASAAMQRAEVEIDKLPARGPSSVEACVS